MQLLLSCAKTMTERGAFEPPHTTHPAFESEARRLAAQLATLPADELAKRLRINESLAAETRRRYHRFHDGAAPTAAIAAYTGIVFRYLDPASLTPAELEYAQQHLHITSFLYGLLRPLDAIRPYRLEGDVPIPGEDDRTPFERWPGLLTEPLLDAVRNDDGVLVNLASAEMQRLFDWRRLRREVRIITPEFRLREGDRLRTVVVYTKMCRGAMARYLLRQHPEDPEALKAFEWEGFRYDAAASRGDRWAFTLG